MGSTAELQIPPEQWLVMCSSAETCLPEEVCGLLAGSGNRVYLAIPVTNQLHSPYRYRMDPEQQLQAFLKIDDLDLELLGIYHSHPQGPTRPSETDIAEAYYPSLVSIILFPSSTGWEQRGYSIRNGEVNEVAILIEESNE